MNSANYITPFRTSYGRTVYVRGCLDHIRVQGNNVQLHVPYSRRIVCSEFHIPLRCIFPIYFNISRYSGIRDSVSFHLNVDAGVIIDPNWIGRKQMTEIRKKAQEFMPYYSMETQAEPSTDHDDLRVVWRRFKNAWADNGQQKAILLCEKEIYNQVVSRPMLLLFKMPTLDSYTSNCSQRLWTGRGGILQG